MEGINIEIGRHCIGSGQCEMLAPSIFYVGQDSRAHVYAGIDVLAVDKNSLDEAVMSCPTNSIEIH